MKQTNAKFFTRGGQITFHNLRMWNQINKKVGHIYFWSFVLIGLLITYVITPHDVLYNSVVYCHATILHWFGSDKDILTLSFNGQHILETSGSIIKDPYFTINILPSMLHHMYWGFGISLALSIGSSFFFVKWLTKRGKEQTDDQFVRGSQLSDAKSVGKQIIKDKKDSSIKINGFPLLKNSEVQHSLLHGTTGSGKGVTLSEFLEGIRARNERCIIYDKGCSFVKQFYRDKSDIILNPFDDRCANWDLWREAIDAPDFENMAESLIPMQGQQDPFWIQASRTIFSSTAYTMQNDGSRSINKLLKLLLTSELKDLEKYIAGTEAATLVSDKIEKTAISIRSVLTTYLKSLRFLQGLDTKGNQPFSIRDWVMDETQHNWLFISSNAEHHSALRPLISMWLAMASITLLGLPENLNRRIWFIVDELPSLHQLPQLAETVAEVRKFGGCFVLGMQSYSQLETVYGRNAARSIFDLLNTRFFFRSPSADMAKLVSTELGTQEVEDLKENYSYGANTIRDGISIGHQTVTRPIVTYPEIMKMKDMHCYLRLPDQYPVVSLTVKAKGRDAGVAGFRQRKMKYDLDIEQTIEARSGRAADKVAPKEELEEKNRKEHKTFENKVKQKNGLITI